MTRVVSPGPQFTRLTEAEVNAALKDPNPGNHIAVEVARLIEGYTENFRAHERTLSQIRAGLEPVLRSRLRAARHEAV
jgi:hypothetical protein